ncbi:MAG: hypothetical protein ABI379_02025 [Rhodanobacter sp.]
MDRSEIEALQQLLLQLATIAKQLDRRSEVAVEHVDASTVALDQALRVLGDGTEQFVRESTRAVGEVVHQAIAQGLGNSLGAFNRQLQATAEVAQRAAHAMEEQRSRLAAARHSLVWNALGALLIGSLLAVGTASYVGWKAVQEVKAAQFAQDILHATASGTLTRCGTDLCVKVGKQVRRYGKNPGYVLISE